MRRGSRAALALFLLGGAALVLPSQAEWAEHLPDGMHQRLGMVALPSRAGQAEQSAIFRTADSTEAPLYHTFEIGPGITEAPGAPEDAGDGYFKYQWGLYNYGQLQVDAEKLRKTEYRLSGEPNMDEAAAAAAGVVTAQKGVDIGMEAAWERYDAKPDKRSVVVAIIDTGMDTNHPELKNALWVNEDEIPGDGVDNDGNGYVDDVNGWNFIGANAQVNGGLGSYHGTHAAGTIGAARGNGGMAGITDNAYIKIMPLKALAGSGTGSDRAVLDAIRYAEANGADICNLSFGGYVYSEEIAQAIQNSRMLFVAAAGNGDSLGRGFSTDVLPVYPASLPCDNVISVANLSFDGNLHSSSNYGAQSVDLAAPGSYILSAAPYGQYTFLSGTSMAAPHVTAAAALLYSYRTDLELKDIKPLLLRNVRKLEGLEGLVASGGMLNVNLALLDGQEQNSDVAG